MCVLDCQACLCTAASPGRACVTDCPGRIAPQLPWHPEVCSTPLINTTARTWTTHVHHPDPFSVISTLC